MLPPSDAQQLCQAPQTQCLGYSAVDKSLTASVYGPQAQEPSLPSPAAPASVEFYVWMERSEGFEGQKFVTADVCET